MRKRRKPLSRDAAIAEIQTSWARQVRRSQNLFDAELRLDLRSDVGREGFIDVNHALCCTLVDSKDILTSFHHRRDGCIHLVEDRLQALLLLLTESLFVVLSSLLDALLKISLRARMLAGVLSFTSA